MSPKLSKRLLAVTELITKGGSVADVGTDHGYIPIYLAANGLTCRALAMDVNEGPLERARNNIRMFGVENTVSTRLSDGLSELGIGETDSIVISGMGGLLIIRILSMCLEKAHAAKELVLSPHSDMDAVRLFLADNGFKITDERIVKEDGKYYFVMRAENGCTNVRNKAALCYGLPLLERRDAQLMEYLERELAIKERILLNLKDNSVDGAQRIRAVENEISIITEGLSYYESV